MNFTPQPQFLLPGTKRLMDWNRSVAQGLGTAALDHNLLIQ